MGRGSGVVDGSGVGGGGGGREEGPRWAAAVLGAEGQLDAAGGVALVAGQALQAAVVVQVAGAGRADAVQLSVGELCAFHVHLNLLLCKGKAGQRWFILQFTLLFYNR